MTDLEIINLYKQGKSCRAIEREYGILKLYVSELLKERKITNEEIKYLYNQGMSCRAIEREYGISRVYIAEILKQSKITIKTSKETSRLYECDFSFFDNIDTEYKAYWLGFLYADGYIIADRKHSEQTWGITISEQDKYHLEKLKQDIKATYPIREIKGSGYNPEGLFCRLEIRSQRMVDKLKSHGMVEQKTKILTYPYDIPINLQRHFIRGYLDGDGFLFKTRDYIVGFLGTEEFLQGIQDYFGFDYSIGKNRSIFELRLCSKKNAKLVLEELYKEANVYLDRKYIKALDMLDLM